MADSTPKKRTSSTGSMISRDPMGAMPRPKPSLRVTDKDLPDIKNWEVGKKYKVVAHVEMKHHSQGDEYSSYSDANPKEHKATFTVHSIAPVKDGEKDK